MSTLPGTPFITINGGSQQTVPLISNDDLLNNAYVAVFTNTSGNYNFAGKYYTGYFKFQGMETAENSVYIIAVGGGGAGGGTYGNVNNEQNGPGQGGGGGGTCLFWFNQLDPAYTYAVNVGVGGGGCNTQGGFGGNTYIDCYDITSNDSYNLQYNLMTAYGGGGGAFNAFVGNEFAGGAAGGGITGIPNWGSYPYDSNSGYEDIGIGNNYSGGTGAGAYSLCGNSTFPQLTDITNNTYATTYNQQLPWINTLIDNIGALQNLYGGGGQQGGYYGNQGSNSSAGAFGIGGAYGGGSNYGCGCSGKSYGDAGGGAYWYCDSHNRYWPATGGNGFQGCIIVVMIPGYSSIACNPNSTVSSIPPVPPPPPLRPPPPPTPKNSQTISASSSEDMVSSTDCCEIDVSVSSSTKDYSVDEIVKNIETDKFIRHFLKTVGFNSLYDLETLLSSSLRYYILQMFYNYNVQFDDYLRYVVPLMRNIRKTSCTFFKNIPGINCNYRCLVITGTENTVRLFCKEDISLNIICIGGGGSGGGGGGGAGGNTCIGQNILSKKNTEYEINVGGGGDSVIIEMNTCLGSSGGSTQIVSTQLGVSVVLLQASGGGGGGEYGYGGVCGNVSTSSSSTSVINNIQGGSGGKSLEYSPVNNFLIASPTAGQTISPNTTITNYLPSYQDILNYFTSNSFPMTINQATCKNIIQNMYGGGGGGGGYYYVNAESPYIYTYTGYGSPGFPGCNGYGGAVNYNENWSPSAVTIGSGGGGGGGYGKVGEFGCGGQGLVIIYWEINEANEEIESQEESKIKDIANKLLHTRVIQQDIEYEKSIQNGLNPGIEPG
jgi:hypothetical protein